MECTARDWDDAEQKSVLVPALDRQLFGWRLSYGNAPREIGMRERRRVGNSLRTQRSSYTFGSQQWASYWE
jgi:hypothetical protein